MEDLPAKIEKAGDKLNDLGVRYEEMYKRRAAIKKRDSEEFKDVIATEKVMLRVMMTV